MIWTAGMAAQHQLIQAIPARWKAKRNVRERCAPIILDTYDGTLFARGTFLIAYPGDPTTLEALGVPSFRAETAERPVPGEPVPAAVTAIVESCHPLARSLGDWTLLDHGEIYEVRQNFAILNEDEKTVCHCRARTFRRTPHSKGVTGWACSQLRGYEDEAEQLLVSIAIGSPFGREHGDTGRTISRSISRGIGPGTVGTTAPPIEASYLLARAPLADGVPAVERDTPAFTAVSLLAHHIVTRADRYRDGVVDDRDPEALHQFRVNLRRARSLISLLKSVFEPSFRRTIGSELREIMSVTNRLRDLDVHLHDEAMLRGAIPNMLVPGFTRVFKRLREERERERERVRGYLRSDQYMSSIDTVKSLLMTSEAEGANGGAKPIAFTLQRAIRRRYQAISATVASLNEHSEPEQLHDLRVSCKKLRYLLEFFPTLLRSKGAKETVRDLKKLQNLLGAYNDLSVQEAFLLNQVDGMRDDTNVAMAIGAAYAQKAGEREDLAEKCMAAARSFCSIARGERIAHLVLWGKR